MTFVRIDGDGEAIPLSEKVKSKYGPSLFPVYDDETKDFYEGD
jgi:hypothetical protein